MPATRAAGRRERRCRFGPVTRSTWTLVAAGALASTVVVWSAAASDVELWHEAPPRERSEQQVDVEIDPVEAPEVLPEFPEEPGEPGDGPDLSLVFKIVLGLGAAVLLTLVVLRLLRLGGTGRRTRRQAAIVPLPEVDLAEVVDDVADDLYRRLASGTPRNAIVECWVVLEDAVAATGRGRRPSETSAEFTARVIGEHSVDATAIGRLAALYREARFSRHELAEDHRAAAVAAVESLRRQLRAPTEEPASEGSA